MRCALDTYHPTVAFWLFAGAIVLSMFVRHPAYLAVSLVCAATSYLTVKGPGSLRQMGWMVVLLVVVAAVNPLFNTQGDTVLFTYFNGRAFTYEALCYGAVMAMLVAAMLLWFGCASAVLTGEKTTYLLRNVAPAGATVLSMTGSMVPRFRRKLANLATARSCIGMSVQTGTFRQRIASGSALLSMLASWALDHSQVTTATMQSRGYGLAGRTSYARRQIGRRDVVLLCVAALLFACATAGILGGSASADYIPAIVLAPLNGMGAASFACFVAFMALPFVVNVADRVKWRALASKI